eukprot:s115_g4.t1
MECGEGGLPGTMFQQIRSNPSYRGPSQDLVLIESHEQYSDGRIMSRNFLPGVVKGLKESSFQEAIDKFFEAGLEVQNEDQLDHFLWVSCRPLPELRLNLSEATTPLEDAASVYGPGWGRSLEGCLGNVEIPGDQRPVPSPAKAAALRDWPHQAQMLLQHPEGRKLPSAKLLDVGIS